MALPVAFNGINADDISAFSALFHQSSSSKTVLSGWVCVVCFVLSASVKSIIARIYCELVTAFIWVVV